MVQDRIETGKSPQLFITCHGDLLIKGWAESSVLLNGDGYTAEESEKGLVIESSGDLKLFVPANSAINVTEAHGDLAAKNFDGQFLLQHVAGDLAVSNLGPVSVDSANGDVRVQNLTGSLTLGEAMGDLSARNVEGIELTTLYGDFAARNVAGGVQITSVMGDVNLRTVNKDVTIDAGHRDVNLRNMGGRIKIADAQGDIRLRGGLTPGKHTLNAQGDIVVRWPVVEPLNLEARAPAIKNRLILSDLVEEEGFLSGRLGDGETFLFLEAKGRIDLKEANKGQKTWQQEAGIEFEVDLDLNGLGEQISSEINYRINEWSKRMETQFSPEFAHKIEQKAQKAAERAERAAERAIRRAEMAAQKLKWQTGQTNWQPPSRPARPSTKDKKATEAEQLKILQMVESGVISPEEATTLLEAIEN
jgi:hypothetical protein